MTDGEALLAAILDNPEEDTPRLVYADWLEENGQEEHAAFIRVQCQLAAMGDPPDPMDGPKGPWLEERSRFAMDHPEVVPLWHREAELLGNDYGRNWRHWAGPAAEAIPNGCFYYDHIRFHRGFVDRVRCDLAAWEQHAADIWSRHPVTRCVLEGRNPEHVTPGSPRRCWHRGNNLTHRMADIPDELFYAIPKESRTGNYSFHDTAELAIDALSRACCVVGRQRAKNLQAKAA